MFLDEWRHKPTNGELVLLGVQSTSAYNGIRASHYIGIKKQDKIVCIYNSDTDRVSDKSVYLDNKGREYIKSDNKKYYLNDFKDK